jgi:hypothetical protein
VTEPIAIKRSVIDQFKLSPDLPQLAEDFGHDAPQIPGSGENSHLESLGNLPKNLFCAKIRYGRNHHSQHVLSGWYLRECSASCTVWMFAILSSSPPSHQASSHTRQESVSTLFLLYFIAAELFGHCIVQIFLAACHEFIDRENRIDGLNNRRY